MQMGEGVRDLTSLIQQEIKFKSNATPVCQAPKRLEPKILEVAQEAVDRILQEDIIERSKSDWCSRPVIVKKLDSSYRFCVDYRDLTKVREEDAYPMKNIDTILDKLKSKIHIED